MKPITISVGNIAMGGTGKTPFTIFLAKHYIAEGERVAILSLGYKGKLGYGTNVISDGNEIFYSPPYAADEPYMMAEALRGKNGAVVITGKDRNSSYAVAMQRFAPTVFLLDDGFQCRRMPRDVDIVLLDYIKPFSTGFLFPFGYLREFPSAVKRADIVVFTRAVSVEIPAGTEKYCHGKPVFFSSNKYMAFNMDETGVDGQKGESVSGYTDGKLLLDYVSGKRVWLMSAIACPEQFNRQIQSLGAFVSGHSVFKDHHNYAEKEIKEVKNRAADSGAEILITTQKDFAKIPVEHRRSFIYPDMSVQMLNQGFFNTLNEYTGGVR